MESQLNDGLKNAPNSSTGQSKAEVNRKINIEANSRTEAHSKIEANSRTGAHSKIEVNSRTGATAR